jgi:hypothetical protein
MSVNGNAMQKGHTVFCSQAGGAVGHIWATELVSIATLQEFDETDRYFTTFHDPKMGLTLRFFLHISSEKDTKECFQGKCRK